MNRAFVRDLEKLLLLFRTEISNQMNFPFDVVNLAFLRFTISTIRCVDL